MAEFIDECTRLSFNVENNGRLKATAKAILVRIKSVKNLRLNKMRLLPCERIVLTNCFTQALQ